MNLQENCVRNLIILFEVATLYSIEEFGPPDRIKNGVIWILAGCIKLIVLLLHYFPEIDVRTGACIVHLDLSLNKCNVMHRSFMIVIRELKSQKCFFKLLVGFPWVDPDLSQMKSITYHKDISRVLLSTQGIGDNVYGTFVTHVTEKDGVTGSYNHRKHTPGIGNSTSPVRQYDDVYVWKGFVLKVPDQSGELNQVIVQLFLSLAICIQGNSHNYDQPQQQFAKNLEISGNHCPKIDKK